MATLASYKIDLEMSTAKFRRQVGQVRKSINSIGDSASAAGRLIGNIIPGVGIAGFTVATKQALDYADSVQKLSIRLGASTEGLTRLGFAAEQTGVSQETLNMALQRQTRRISEAANGTGEAVKALEELNLSAESLNQLAPDEQFRLLADAIKDVENPADRVRLAMKLFDSEGVALVQTMEGGSAALDAFGAEADRLGITLSRSAVDQAAAANDALNRLNRASGALTQTLAIQLGPTIENVANFMTSALGPTIDFIGRAFDGLRFTILKVVNASLKSLQFLVEQLAKLPDALGGDMFQGAADSLQLLTESLDFTAGRFLEGATGVAKFNSTIAEIPARVEAATSALSASGEGGISSELQQMSDALQEIEVTAKRIQVAPLTAGEGGGAGDASMLDRLFGPDSLQSLIGDFKNIEDRFKQMLANMLAEALSAQISQAILGGGGSGGGLGAFFGSLFGARATGGPVTANRPYLVGEQGPEIFVPPSNGRVMASGSTGAVSINMTVLANDADSFIRSSSQVEAATARALRRAGRNA